jgi:hypothetical protein
MQNGDVYLGHFVARNRSREPASGETDVPR